MIDAIIFDAEGVVFDSETIWDKGQREFLGRRGISYDRRVLKPQLTGRSLVEGVRVMQDLYGFSGDLQELARERIDIVRPFFETEVRFLNGFLEFFMQFRSNYKTCIATSLASNLLASLEKSLQLSSLFAGNVFSIADVGNVGKPAPDLFLFAARRLDTQAAHCLVIEDAPLGIAAAKRAGMRCVALTTTYEREMLTEADLIVESFAQLDLSQM
jgi:beta-phosphoglucomutase-like phosphatase (HAD superfamily)